MTELDKADLETKQQHASLLKAQARMANAEAEKLEKENKKEDNR